MQYRRLGNSNLVVSVIGMGTWQFGDAEWGASPADLKGIFDAARRLGVTLIDTAECYGDHTAEKRIGEQIEGDRARWIVATKFGHRYRGPYDREEDFTAAGMRAQLERSLEALRSDYVDVLQVHNMSAAHVADEELWRALEDVRREGKVRAIGAAIKFDPAMLQPDQLEMVQVIYNRLDRRAEGPLLDKCAERSLGVLARVPLARGMLTGKYQVGKRFPEGDPRHGYTPDSIDQQLAEARKVAEDEVPEGVPLARYALSWCLRHPALTAVIPGCKSVKQLEANAAAAELDILQQQHPQRAEPPSDH